MILMTALATEITKSTSFTPVNVFKFPQLFRVDLSFVEEYADPASFLAISGHQHLATLSISEFLVAPLFFPNISAFELPENRTEKDHVNLKCQITERLIAVCK